MEKIKSFIESEKGKDVLIVLIVVLVGLASFELGRLSKENGSSGLKIEYPSQDSQTANAISFNQNSSNLTQNEDASVPSVKSTSTESSGKNFVASSRGKKYYPIGCPAGSNLKESNKIYFASREEAEKAGYALSSACQ